MCTSKAKPGRRVHTDSLMEAVVIKRLAKNGFLASGGGLEGARTIEVGVQTGIWARGFEEFGVPAAER